jgi:hypothetical protein
VVCQVDSPVVCQEDSPVVCQEEPREEPTTRVPRLTKLIDHIDTYYIGGVTSSTYSQTLNR